ncbi:MAG: alpha/beta fold hydrolase [Alphaproteobacteria bacterium]
MNSRQKGVITMARLGETMETGTLVAWLKHPGDTIKRGEIIAEIETDKTVVEMPALEAGILAQTLVEEGGKVPVGAPIALLQGAVLEGASMAGEKSEAPDAKSPTTAPVEPGAAGQKPRATPGARRLAAKTGQNLEKTNGTGRRGRVRKVDLEPVHAAGTVLHARVIGQGDGVPLVFLHGLGGDSAGWANLQLAHSLNRQTIALDLPGHGGSLESAGTASLEVLDACVRTTLRSLGGRFHLVGHSVGGGIAARLALGTPELAASLTLIAPSGITPEINARLLRRFAEAATPQAMAPLIEQFFGETATIPAGMAAQAATARASPAHRRALGQLLDALVVGGQQATWPVGRLGELACPVKVIWGSEDRILAPGNLRRLPGTVARHVFIGAGHMVHLERHSEIAALIGQNISAGENIGDIGWLKAM